MQQNAARTDEHVASAEAHGMWAADPIHLPHIRALIRSWLVPLALDGDTQQDLVLAVNEAASNAIEHAYVAPGPDDLVKVSFWTEPHHLNFEVADHGRWRVADAHPGHRGRGILIMRKMVGSVSFHREVDGTRVLMRHPLVW